MAIRKRKTKSGITWAYYFDLPGSSRESRNTITESGFATKKEAMEAEADRRISERDLAEARARGVTSAIPKTLGELLGEFCSSYADRELAPKTVERYRQQIPYLSPELLAMPVGDITSLHFTREWNRLRESGGHVRKSKAPRPLSSKSVRNVASFVSSAFSEAIAWGFARINPVTNSKKPRGGERRKPIALSVEQQRLLVEASNHWVLPTIIEVCAGLGARRGEVLALRWSDIHGDEALISRSLSQTKQKLHFKDTKTGNAGIRIVTIPPSTMAVIEKHRERQAEFRRQFGPDYQSDLDLVFCNPDGSPLKPDSISGTASNLFRKLKMPAGAGVHALRHTHGSQLLAAGMEISAVSARLGHSSPSVTAKVYSHILSGRDRTAAELWEKLQSKDSTATAPARKSGLSATNRKAKDIENERIRPN